MFRLFVAFAALAILNTNGFGMGSSGFNHEPQDHLVTVTCLDGSTAQFVIVDCDPSPISYCTPARLPKIPC